MNYSTPIYLASQSPRRHQLLEQIDYPFVGLHQEVDESVQDDITPEAYATRLALLKATVGWRHLDRIELWPVLGADTIVVVDDVIFGKPRNQSDALAMLAQLSGRTHTVITALALCQKDQIATAISHSTVTFTDISVRDQLAYWNSGEGVDKAGSYALQGLGAIFIKEVRGSFSGVMGLPLFEFHQLVKSFTSQKT